MSFHSLCRRTAARFRVRTRYTRALEEEVARLRAENRALVNSILGVAGIAPMRTVATTHAARSNSAVHVRYGDACGTDTGNRSRPKGRPYEGADKRERQVACEIAVPLRKRSWQQIERAREIEDARAARRARETDTETFPAPRNIVPRV